MNKLSLGVWDAGSPAKPTRAAFIRALALFEHIRTSGHRRSATTMNLRKCSWDLKMYGWRSYILRSHERPCATAAEHCPGVDLQISDRSGLIWFAAWPPCRQASNQIRPDLQIHSQSKARPWPSLGTHSIQHTHTQHIQQTLQTHSSQSILAYEW